MPRLRSQLLRTIGIMLIVTATIGYLLYLTYCITKPYFRDFWWYDYAFRVAWLHEPGNQLYNMLAEGKWAAHLGRIKPFHDAYVYPPQFALMLGWLGGLPTRVGMWIWACLLLGAYGGTIAMLRSMALQQAPWSARFWTSLFIIVAAVFYLPYQSDFLNQNSDTFVLFLTTLCFYGIFVKGARVWTGIPLGIAIVMKLTPALLLIYLVARRMWKTLIGTLVTIVIVTVATGAWFGWAPLFQYIRSVHHFSTVNSLDQGPMWNSSFQGLLQWFNDMGLTHLSSRGVTVTFLTYAVIVAAIIVVTFALTKFNPQSDAALLALSLVVLSPLVEDHYMLLCLIPLTMWIGFWRELPTPPNAASGRPLWWSPKAWTMYLILLTYGVIEYVGFKPHLFIGMEVLFVGTVVHRWYGHFRSKKTVHLAKLADET